jgi:hypothetical protein
MVELITLQTISQIASSTGVVLGVIYYMVNLREQMKNRRVALATQLITTINSEGAQRKYYELMSMQWKDFEDFKRKYDSSVNPENYIKRFTFWQVCDHVGWQYRKGLVDLETIYYAAGLNIYLMWRKFKPLINSFRSWQYQSAVYENWEYLADAIGRMLEDRDPRALAQYDDAVNDSFKNEDLGSSISNS